MSARLGGRPARFYRLSLRCYPQGYRARFADEMFATFQLNLMRNLTVLLLARALPVVLRRAVPRRPARGA